MYQEDNREETRMKMKELAEYCEKTKDCRECEHTDACARFKQYLQDFICPATTRISGYEKIYGADREI